MKICQWNDCLLLEDGWLVGWLVGWWIGLLLCLFICKLFNDVRSKSYIALTGRNFGE